MCIYFIKMTVRRLFVMKWFSSGQVNMRVDESLQTRVFSTVASQSKENKKCMRVDES